MSIRLKYTFAGILIGTLFPLAAWILEVELNGLDWSLTTLIQIHSNNPLHYIIESATLVLGVIFFVLGSSAAKIRTFTNHELYVTAAALFSSRDSRINLRTIWVLVPITIILCLLVIFAARALWLKTLEEEGVEASSSLTAILYSTKDSVEGLLQPAVAVTRVLSTEDEALHLAQVLLPKRYSRQILRDATEQPEFVSWIENRLVGSVTDAAILSADGIFLAATSADWIGLSSNFSSSGLFMSQLADHGEAICRPCDLSGDLELPPDSDLSRQSFFLVGHQIVDDSGRFIATLMLQIELYNELSSLLANRKLGLTGEIYAVNEFGYIISSVRFADPGDSTQAAGRLSHSGMSQEHMLATESSVITHRDYRDIPVLARHVWLADMTIGLVVQSTAEEVYSDVLSIRTTFIFVAAIIVALIISIALFVANLLSASERTKLISKNAEHRMRLIVNAAAEGIYGIDLSGNCTFANQACFELTGYENEAALLGKNMHELIHHSFKDKTPYRTQDCQIYKAFRKGQNVHVNDEVFWRADGTSFDAEYHSNPLFQDEAISGAVVTFTDISVRRSRQSAEDAAQRKLQGFRDALDELSRAATLVSLEAGTRGFFESAAKILANALEVERVGIWRYTSESQDLVSECLFDRTKDNFGDAASLSKTSAPDYFSIIGQELQSINDLRKSERYEDAYRKYFKPLNIIAILSAPITVQARPIGVVTFAQTAVTRDWDDYDRQFAISAALTLAVAMETVQKLATEHRQQSLVETMVDGLITIDETGVIESFNPAAETIFGYDKKQVIGKNITMLMDSPYREQHQSHIERYRKGGESNIVGKSGIEVVGLHKSGKHVPISISVSEMAYAGRRIFSGVIRDITLQMQMQRERESAMADTEKIIDSANAPIFGVNKRLQVTEWNRFITELTGYEKDEVVNCLFVNEFIDEADRPKVRAVLRAALAGTQTQSFETTLVTRSGDARRLLLSAAPRYDVEGKISGVIGIGQDISELRQKDAALQQAQKMEAVGQLTGGIAHDFNNLLSIIKGNLRFLQEDVEDVVDGTSELFEDAMSAVEDGAALTQRLSAFSRTSSLQTKPIDLCQALYSYTRFLDRTVGAEHELRTDVPDEPVFIDVDSTQLDNALLNLVINARDALPDGGPITIDLEAVTIDEDEFDTPIQSGPYARISVSDCGTGIDPENVQHVFEPFFTTKSVEKGSGLGLSMVYGFVRQSGGACRVESELGKGTTISIFLPQTSNRPDDKRGAKSPAIHDDTPDSVILVVEDDPRVRRTVIRDLGGMGYQILEAETADMAQDIIKSGESVDLVFTDILMPGKLDGRSLAQWITDNHYDMEVVLTSGYSDRKTGVSIDDQFPMIRKPYTLDGLSKIIRDSLLSK